MAANKDAGLKRQVHEVLERCNLDKLHLDKEVQLNFDGDTDDEGNPVAEKEIDVIAKFRYGGKHIALFFECENSTTSKSIRAHYRGYAAQVEDILQRKASVRVVNSADRAIDSRHFRDIDEIHVCFVFGSQFPHQKYLSHKAEAEKHGFLVWNFMALQYYRKISSIVGSWMKYELFKDFSLDLERAITYDIPALQLSQEGHTMFLAKIHPGLLLKIGYVVRRATEKTYAYQRLLNGERIKSIAEFISSTDDRNFLPNAVLAVFDNDAQTQSVLRYNAQTWMLTIPVKYCSAWIIDGQHRAFGFLGTPYED